MPARIGPRKPIRVYLALWRDHHHLTQEQLGERFEPPVEKGTISRWETAGPGKLTLGVIAAFAEALGQKATDMYDPPPPKDAEPSLDALAVGLDSELRKRAADVITALHGRRKAG